MRRPTPTRLVVAASLLAACSSPDPHAPSAASATATVTPPAASSIAPSASGAASAAPIGQAKMLEDGTIVLDLFRPAMVQRRYAKTDAEYASILAHVGPLAPGESKPVAPWPDDLDDARVAEAVKAHVASSRGWAEAEWTHEIMGTDADGNVVVTVTFKKDLEARAQGGGKSFQLRLAPKTYAFVRELAFQ